MKNILTFILIFVSFISFSQMKYDNGVVNYGVNFNKDFSKDIEDFIRKNRNLKSNLKYLKNIIHNHKKIYSSDLNFLELSFNKNTYVLKPLDIMLPDNLQGKFIFKSSIYYGDLKKDVYLNQFVKRGKTYIVPFNECYNWEIKNKQKKLLGFQCRKAVIKNEVHSKKYNITNTSRIVAWFTPQIPVAFSPVKYNGLPGAILEVTTPMKHIYAKDIKFKEDVDVEKPTEGIKLSKEEYKEMMTRFKPD